MLIALIGLAAIIFALIIGGMIAESQNPPTITPGKDGQGTSCGELCANLQVQHANHCMAESDEQSAEARLRSLADQRNGFLIAAAVALAAGFACLAFVFTAPAAIAFFVAAAALGALALGLEGAMIAAENDRARKAGAVRATRQTEADAQALLIEKCSDGASACIAMLGPC